MATTHRPGRDLFANENWYVGCVSERRAEELLMAAVDRGNFLVRDSLFPDADYVLSVRDGSKVWSYDLRVEPSSNECSVHKYSFPDLPTAIAFYCENRLGQTYLRAPHEPLADIVVPPSSSCAIKMAQAVSPPKCVNLITPEALSTSYHVEDDNPESPLSPQCTLLPQHAPLSQQCTLLPQHAPLSQHKLSPEHTLSPQNMLLLDGDHKSSSESSLDQESDSHQLSITGGPSALSSSALTSSALTSSALTSSALTSSAHIGETPVDSDITAHVGETPVDSDITAHVEETVDSDITAHVGETVDSDITAHIGETPVDSHHTFNSNVSMEGTIPPPIEEDVEPSRMGSFPTQEHTHHSVLEIVAEGDSSCHGNSDGEALGNGCDEFREVSVDVQEVNTGRRGGSPGEENMDQPGRASEGRSKMESISMGKGGPMEDDSSHQRNESDSEEVSQSVLSSDPDRTEQEMGARGVKVGELASSLQSVILPSLLQGHSLSSARRPRRHGGSSVGLDGIQITQGPIAVMVGATGSTPSVAPPVIRPVKPKTISPDDIDLVTGPINTKRSGKKLKRNKSMFDKSDR